MAAGDYRPLKVDSTVGASDLKEMTDAEIKDKIVPVILTKWATNQSDAQRGNIQLRATTTTGNLGYFVDTKRDDPIGTHPSGAAYTTYGQYGFASNDDSLESTGGEVWPLYSESQSAIQEMNAAKLIDDIMRCCEEVYAEASLGSTGIGSYYFGLLNPYSSHGGTWIDVSGGTNAPSGGEHTATATNTQHGESDDVYTLFRKTAHSGLGTIPPVKYKGTSGDVQQMSDAEIETLTNHFINRITSGPSGNGIGTYIMTTSGAPGSGTWVYAGGFTDYMCSVSDQQYSSQYSGQYTGYWSGQYRTTYGNYGGARYGPWYTGQYSTQYSGQYTGYWTGATVNDDAYSNIQTNYGLYRRLA
jgi:hypothetical protein